MQRCHGTTTTTYGPLQRRWRHTRAGLTVVHAIASPTMMTDDDDDEGSSRETNVAASSIRARNIFTVSWRDHVERDRITVLLRTQRTTSRDDTIPMRDKFSRGRRTRRRHHPPLLRDPSSSMTTWMQHLRATSPRIKAKGTTSRDDASDDEDHVVVHAAQRAHTDPPLAAR